MAPTTNMARLETLVAKLPETERVDVEQRGDHPTFRVRGKNFLQRRGHVTEWIVTSYTLVAPKRLAQAVLDDPAL